jgi:hypothetical protein
LSSKLARDLRGLTQSMFEKPNDSSFTPKSRGTLRFKLNHRVSKGLLNHLSLFHHEYLHELIDMNKLINMGSSTLVR